MRTPFSGNSRPKGPHRPDPPRRHPSETDDDISFDSLERSCVLRGLVLVAVPLSLIILCGVFTSCRSEVWGRASVEVR